MKLLKKIKGLFTKKFAKKLTQDKLDSILEKHKKWLVTKKGGKLADFRNVNLEGFNFVRKTLDYALFSGANLATTNFSLSGLTFADFHKADLHDANFNGANLIRADLSEADLRRAWLGSVNLEEADLRGANLREANLWEANLTNAKLPDFQIPQDEVIIGYKKCVILHSCTIRYIVTLEIPAEAKRTANLVGNKCRCEFAKVIKIEKINKNNELEEIKDKDFEVRSMWDNDFFYRLNQVVKPDIYNDDIRLECTNGIHFFVNKQDAINY